MKETGASNAHYAPHPEISQYTFMSHNTIRDYIGADDAGRKWSSRYVQ
jgi:hypothetical protein